MRVGEKELARFGAEKTNAQDFANGYNAAQAEVTRLRRLLLEARGWLGGCQPQPAAPFLDEIDAALADKQPEPPIDYEAAKRDRLDGGYEDD